MSTTACFVSDPIVGEWNLYSAEEPCLEYTKSYTYEETSVSYSNQICLDFDALKFSVENIKDAGFQGTLIEQQGTVSMTYSYTYGSESNTGTYSYDMISGNEMEIEALDTENTYRISIELSIDNEDVEEGIEDEELDRSMDADDSNIADLEFNCTLATSAINNSKSLKCDFIDIIIDEDSYAEDFTFSGSITFTK